MPFPSAAGTCEVYSRLTLSRNIDTVRTYLLSIDGSIFRKFANEVTEDNVIGLPVLRYDDKWVPLPSAHPSPEEACPYTQSRVYYDRPTPDYIMHSLTTLISHTPPRMTVPTI